MSKKTHSWEFTFKDLTTGQSVAAGVFATEFSAARAKAIEQLVSSTGGPEARFQYQSYSRLT